MKKIYLIVLMFIGIKTFSQSPESKIQDFLNLNYKQFDLLQSDVTNWNTSSFATIDDYTKVYYINQSINNIKIYNAQSSVTLKNDNVVYYVNRFERNIAEKINGINPSIDALSSVSIAYSNLNLSPSNSPTIISNENNNYKVTNGFDNSMENQVELVYYPSKNVLKLAWNVLIQVSSISKYYTIIVDANNGNILEKKEQLISCNFENHNHIDNDVSQKNEKIEHVSLVAPTSILNNNDYANGTYRVVPFTYESPKHSDRVLINNAVDVTSSPRGWHDANSLTGNVTSLKYTYTRGNNVFAQADYNGNDPTTYSATTSVVAQGGSGLMFDFAYPGTSVTASQYVNAAITNLFYMTNSLHDIWYHYGFNEINGNFQQNNYTYGATGNDYLFADAQDGSQATTPTLNNANFYTPVDGQKPRMNMYLWSYRKIHQLLNITSPEEIAGLKYTSDNGFNPGHVSVPVAPNAIQTDLVLYDDGSQDVGVTDNADACSAAINSAAINGHIVVIRRSTSVANGGDPCTFVAKTLNAQAAGAVAVIIVNNDSTAPNSSIGMSGADATINIPVISVSQNDGEAIISKLKSGATVNGKIQSEQQLDLFVNTDGDFDNSVIAHEFGHGISTRLAGGRLNSSCLNNYEQMGEGWSDWFSLMINMKPTDTPNTPKPMATFVINQNNDESGLRSFPYCYDMSVNPLTFNDSNSAIPEDPADTGYRYVIGDFWSSVLWDLTWKYVEKYGFSDDKYNGTAGNNKVMKLVLDAIKLQPCNPTMIDGRDALIQADQVTTGGQDYCMITEVFTRRGMGLNASSGSKDDCNDQVEDFTSFPAGPNCVMGINEQLNNRSIKLYPNPSNGIVNLEVQNFKNNIDIEIYDLLSRKVFNTNVNFDNSISLDLSKLVPGTYFVNILSNDNKITSKLIIK